MTSRAGSLAGAPAGDPVASLYVYGVVPAAAGPWQQLEGLGDPPGPVSLLAEGPVAALTSPLAPDFVPGRRADLEAHERVVAAALERTTIVPMRFGVVIDGEEEVREQLLRRHAGELAGLLEALEGHVQMSLKAFYAGEALVREVAAERPELAGALARLRGRPEAETRSARVAIGERVASEMARRREDDERALLDRVGRVVADVRAEPPRDARMALNAQLLVRRDRRAELDAVVGELSREQSGRLALRYTGPIAPYSFADVALDG